MPGKIPAAVLCGGRGSRLSEVFSEKPKAMAPLMGKPFLEHLTNFLYSHDLRELYFMAGSKGEYIEEYVKTKNAISPLIAVHRETTPLGTGGATALCFGLSHHDVFLVVNGDTLFDFPLKNFLKEGLHLLSSGRAKAVLALSRSQDPRYSHVHIENSQVVSLTLPSSQNATEGFIDAGFSLLHRSALEFLPAGFSSLNIDLYPRLVETNALAALPYDGAFIDFGVPKDFWILEDIFRQSSWSRLQQEI